MTYDPQDQTNTNPIPPGAPGTQSQDAGPTASQAPPPVGFCQNCGRPLSAASVRRLGEATLCEPCLTDITAARAAAGPGAGYPGSVPPPYGTYPQAPFAAPPAVPNPGLAALLGFIPGVGAMYNEQYAKGFVHLLVFVILVALTDANGIFLIFVFGWEFYMAMEAHHTAKARRDGLPMPNPFGLNDIGERLGFGKSWPGRADVGGFTRDAAGAVAQGFRNGPNAGTGPGTAANPAAPWGAPAYSYGGGVPPGASSPYGQPSQEPAAPAGSGAPVPPAYGWNPVPDPTAAFQPGPFQPGYPVNDAAQASHFPGTAGVPPAAPPWGVSGNPYAGLPPMPPTPPQTNRVPAGAIWLIGLGTLFLLLTTGRFSGIPPHALIGFGLLALGVWLFVRRMLDSGSGLRDDGSHLYQFRLLRALRGSAWVALVGVWFLLGAFGILRMSRSWPLFIILAGIMTLLERLAMNRAAASASPYAPPFAETPGTSGPPPYPPAHPESRIVPTGASSAAATTRSGFSSGLTPTGPGSDPDLSDSTIDTEKGR